MFIPIYIFWILSTFGYSTDDCTITAIQWSGYQMAGYRCQTLTQTTTPQSPLRSRR